MRLHCRACVPARHVLATCTAMLLLSMTACGGGDAPPSPPANTPPDFISGPISESRHDGPGSDLLTAGLGRSGLAAAAVPLPATPSAADLRRLAIHTNYRALIDFTSAGGFGLLYGPNLDKDGANTRGEGLIPGTETIAYTDDGTGRQNVTLMIQVPDSFDRTQPCIVTATSSGSRGIYGAIATAGEWGLKRGCAVAYTDKGSGNGFHDLMSDLVTRRDGTLGTADAVGSAAQFRAALSPAERASYNAQFPQRVAYKHAHSEQNPEKDWGRHTLQAVKFAFYVLNERFGEPLPDRPGQRSVVLTPANTLVLASSVSNGGGAALAAAEQDTEGLIDGVAVAEPQVQPSATEGLVIQQGGIARSHGRSLADYFTLADIYQPCALLSSQAGLSMAAAFWPTTHTAAAEARCAGLQAKGLLTGATLAAQADEALLKLQQAGWLPESNFLHQSHFRLATHSVALTYINAYGRFKVSDNICGYSFANTNATGEVIAQSPTLQLGLFATGNGIPPTSGIQIVYHDGPPGTRLDFLASSPSTGQADFALDGVLCLRSLVTGRDPVTDAPLTGTPKAHADRVQAGIREVQLQARLNGKPAIIVAGRNDTLIPVNHAARAYVGRHLQQTRAQSSLRYIEVTNAQHFDTFMASGAALGYDSRFVPLHRYFNQAMDMMYAHLKAGAALPPSQVVRTTPRAVTGGLVEPITTAHVPPINPAPGISEQITFTGNTLNIPD